MKKILAALVAVLALTGMARNSHAHFGMIIPSESTVMEQKNANIELDISFSHPFMQNGMDMKKPREFFVSTGGGAKTDLTSSLRESKYMDHQAWKASYKISRPGVYQFAVVPEPYFEAAEDCFIIHFVKTLVGAYGSEAGWDKPLGLPVEIVALSRPFANYAANVFRGQVLKGGKPLPGAVVEIEYLNSEGKYLPPNGYFETQTVVTDENGIFSYGIPWAGWWGFAALTEGASMPMQGQDKDVELGGVIWLDFAEPKIR